MSTSSCGCVGLHDGMSHAEHMDRLWAEKNDAIRRDASDLTNRAICMWEAYRREELARLQAKGWQLEMEAPAP